LENHIPYFIDNEKSGTVTNFE